ncbi:hypothetical protein D8S78_23435 [Natrialba swarupiae]|nr:hypothetical protein [Natrialba swarupiae]
MGRQKRYDLYDLFIEKPDPIVDRENIYEVDERLHPREGVVTPLDEDELASLVEDIEDDYESVAVSFLHSTKTTDTSVRRRRLSRTSRRICIRRARRAFRNNTASTSGRTLRWSTPTSNRPSSSI